MSRAQLEHALQRLRAELDQLDGDVEARLRGVIAELEGQIEALDSAQESASMVNNLKRHIEQFEVEHPKVTNILNDVMVTLSNMGI